MTEKKKRTLEDNQADERKLLIEEEELQQERRQIEKREEEFFSAYGQSISHVRNIMEYYSHPSAHVFYEDLMTRMEGTQRALAISFEDKKEAVSAKTQKVHNQLNDLYEERLKLNFQNKDT